MSLSFLADHAIFIVFYSCLLCSRISPFNFIVPYSYEAGKSANNCKTLSSFDINVSQGLIVGSVGGFPRRNRHERPNFLSGNLMNTCLKMLDSDSMRFFPVDRGRIMALPFGLHLRARK